MGAWPRNVANRRTKPGRNRSTRARTHVSTWPVRTVDIEEGAKILARGGLVAFPTETVYGLGADAENPAAVARIFAAKGRPTSHPLIAHIQSTADVARYTRSIPPSAQRLADMLWPGPLTLIFERGERIGETVSGGLPTIALRVPAHPLALALLDRFGRAIAAPSANRFGAVSPTTADHVRRDLGSAIDAVIDGGPCTVGIESTIVDVTQMVPTLLRPGGVARETLEQILGAPVPSASDGSVRAPGMLVSHYAPRARVIAVRSQELAASIAALQASTPTARIVVLAPANIQSGSIERIDLPESEAERARTLYATLREIDERGADIAVVVLPESEQGISMAIADRIRRAAGPR